MNYLDAQTEYVMGLAFSEDRKNIVLIHKKHGPAYVVGKFNGVGGKIEYHKENAHGAMIREFQEEAGVLFTPWNNFAILVGKGYRVYCFKAFHDDLIYISTTKTDECIYRFTVSEAYKQQDLVPNLRYLIPMALDDNVIPPVILYVRD